MKRYLIHVVFILCVISSVSFFILTRATMTIFPGNDFIISIHRDKKLPHSIEILNYIKSSSSVSLSYKMNKNSKNSYIGIKFTNRTIDKYIDLSPFDTVELSVQTAGARTLYLLLNTYIKNYSRSFDHITYLHNQHEIPTWKQQAEYSINIKELTIPVWWYVGNQFPEGEKTIKPNYAKTQSIIIQNRITEKNPVIDTIIINRITLYKSLTPQLQVCIGIIIILYLIVIIIIRCLHGLKQKKRNKVISIDTFVADNSIDYTLQAIVTCIGRNYTNSTLTIKMLEKHCGIPSYKIAQLLKQHYGLTFPQYLNTIRHAEAKRLLKNCDLKIIEIAKLTGFGSISHFTRLFKRHEGLSPVEYRKKSI